jgi:hypothetical protein
VRYCALYGEEVRRHGSRFVGTLPSLVYSGA